MGYMILSQKIHNFGVLILESGCRGEKCVFERRSERKTHDVYFLEGKRARKHKPEAIRAVLERKVCFREKK